MGPEKIIYDFNGALLKNTYHLCRWYLTLDFSFSLVQVSTFVHQFSNYFTSGLNTLSSVQLVWKIIWCFQGFQIQLETAVFRLDARTGHTYTYCQRTSRDRDRDQSQSRSFLVPMIDSGPIPSHFWSQRLVQVPVLFLFWSPGR